MSKEYMSMRKEIWQPLADRCNVKWNVVEQKVTLLMPSNPIDKDVLD
jgi:hypothetical protein